MSKNQSGILVYIFLSLCVRTQSGQIENAGAYVKDQPVNAIANCATVAGQGTSFLAVDNVNDVPGFSEANHLFGRKRTGYRDEDLAPPYYRVWTYRHRNEPCPAWREPAWEVQRIDFDYAYPLSAANGLVYVASSSDHSIHALDLESGELIWSFPTGGPVRLAPHVQGEYLWFASDDGWAYCLNGLSGKLVWKYRPDIPDERLVGNDRIISRWPCRSGILIDGNKAYTTFGMLSPEGIVVTCMDAATGKLIWENDSSGTYYMRQPHFEAMGGVSPQGYLAMDGGVLVVPCGRSTPAYFNAETGEFLYHESEGLFPGGAWTMLHEGLVFMSCPYLQKPNPVVPDAAEAEIGDEASLVAVDSQTHEEIFHLKGALFGVVSDKGVMSLVGPDSLLSVELKTILKVAPECYRSKLGSSEGHFVDVKKVKLWSTPVKRIYKLIQAGNTLIAGGRGALTAYNSDDGKPLWSTEVEGDVRELLVVEDSLLISTTEGHIHCFRPGRQRQARTTHPKSISIVVSDEIKKVAENIISVTENAGRIAHSEGGGYAVLLDSEPDPSLFSALATSSTHVWHLATQVSEIEHIRSKLTSAGLYGTRAIAHSFKGRQLPYSDFIASVAVLLVRSEDDLQFVQDLYRILRPHAGIGYIGSGDELKPAIKKLLLPVLVSEKELLEIDSGILINRVGLPGAGAWTHQYADPGKSGASTDERVKLPLKALWFGSIGPADIVTRHYRAPAPLVINNRMFVSGQKYLHAIDAYTGRILWERKLVGVGRWPMSYRGGSAAVDEDFVYVLRGDTCLQLEQGQGITVQTYHVPDGVEPPDRQTGKEVDSNNPPIWEYLAVDGDTVIGTYGRANVREQWWSCAEPENSLLFALDKKTGKEKWRYESVTGIDSAAIAIDDGKVFLIDGMPDIRVHKVYKQKLAQLLYQFPSSDKHRQLKALDIESGVELWKTGKLSSALRSLWAANDVVLATATHYHARRLSYDGDGLTAFCAQSGAQLWSQKEYAFEPVIIGDTVYLPMAVNLQTGKRVLQVDPQTGKPFAYLGGLNRGCSRPAGCPNILMHRSGSLGFMDLNERSTGYTYPNMRASCWLNMVPASGLVLVPEGGSSCPCAYNYKTSIAFMPSKRHNHWGLFPMVKRAKHARIRNLYLNMGAPGDRPISDMEVWYAFPRPSSAGPRGAGGMGVIKRDSVPVQLINSKDEIKRIACNPDWVKISNTQKPWVHSFGLAGALRIKIDMGSAPAPSLYRVSLTFCELEGKHAPSDTFSVKMQDVVVYDDLNVRRDANGCNRLLVKQVDLELHETLSIEVIPQGANPPLLTGVQVNELMPDGKTEE